MRPLTFAGFLESYVGFLAGRDTLALRRLAAVLPAEPRLVEPLLLWATVTERADRLARLLADRPDLVAEMRLLASLAEVGDLEYALESEDTRLRPEYAKAWRSYAVRRDASKRDSRLKLVARDRVLALEAERGVSRYRMARDLGLNPGNLHAFLSQGRPEKLGLEKVLALVKYLEAA